MQPSPTSITINLPVYVNRVVENVPQMTEQAFKKNWDDISFNKADFHKMDCILSNPAPPSVPTSAVVQ